jgi:hypothetical protein
MHVVLHNIHQVFAVIFLKWRVGLLASTWKRCIQHLFRFSLQEKNIYLDLGTGRDTVLQYWYAITKSPSISPHCLGTLEGKKCKNFQ